MTPELYQRSKRAVQVITADGRQISGGRAAMFVLQTIGYLPLLARLGRVWPIVWAVELGYRIIAHNRPFFSRIAFRGIQPTAAELAAIGSRPSNTGAPDHDSNCSSI